MVARRSKLDDDLLEAIRAAPADDAPRLVYADWLAERGDPRGELIHLQCRLASLPPGDRSRTAIERRERALMRAHLDEWREPLAKLGVTRTTFVRGLVEEIAVPVRVLADHGEAIFAAAPLVSRLDIDAPIEHARAVRKLAASPLLGRITDVRFGQEANLIEQDARRIFASPHLTSLRRIEIDWNHVSRRSLKAINHNRVLRLEALELPRCGLDDTGAEVLARAPRLGELRVLSLASNHLRDAGLAVLGRSPAFPALRDLDLAYNKPTRTGLRAFAKSPLVAQLAVLRLHDAHAAIVRAALPRDHQVRFAEPFGSEDTSAQAW